MAYVWWGRDREAVCVCGRDVTGVCGRDVTWKRLSGPLRDVAMRIEKVRFRACVCARAFARPHARAWVCVRMCVRACVRACV